MSKQAYRNACEAGLPVPLFSQPWWLDAVAGPSGWDVVVVEHEGKIVASMPYAIGRRWMFRVSMQPAATQCLGPWFEQTRGKRVKIAAREKKLMEQLIEGLPRFALFQQNWHYSRTNWLPFQWKGFEQTTRYTYVIKDVTCLEKVWDGFDQNIRTDIRKAEGRFNLEIRTDLSLDSFLRLHWMVFERQGIASPYHVNFVRKLHDDCLARSCVRVFIAEDRQGRHHAAALVVWDNETAYYLMGGADPMLRNSGASSLCLWAAIRFAAAQSLRFDFEGSMLEPVERFFRAFGAEQVPYHRVRRVESRMMQTILFARSLLGGRCR